MAWKSHWSVEGLPFNGSETVFCIFDALFQSRDALVVGLSFRPPRSEVDRPAADNAADGTRYHVAETRLQSVSS